MVGVTLPMVGAIPIMVTDMAVDMATDIITLTTIIRITIIPLIIAEEEIPIIIGLHPLGGDQAMQLRVAPIIVDRKLLA